MLRNDCGMGGSEGGEDMGATAADVVSASMLPGPASGWMVGVGDGGVAAAAASWWLEVVGDGGAGDVAGDVAAAGVVEGPAAVGTLGARCSATWCSS